MSYSESIRYELDLVDVEEVQRMLSVPRRQVYRLLKILPEGVVVRVNRLVRFNRPALLAWIKKGGSHGHQC